MKSNKCIFIKKLGVILLSAACLISIVSLSLVVAIGRSKDSSQLPKAMGNACYAYDISDPKLNAGYADYIFFGRAAKILRTEQESKDDMPETVYEIEVLENLKGELQPTVELYKFGGVTQKGLLQSLYIDRSFACMEGDYFPEIGDICIFYASADENNKLVSPAGPPFTVLLSKGESSAGRAAASEILMKEKSNPIYAETIDAIAHQVVPEILVGKDRYIANADMANKKD